nr:hypothetical protein [Tanacetum cinerariifolium]
DRIICHEKVVRIPLLDGKVLRVLGERSKEKARLLMSTKTRDKREEETVVIELIPGVVPVAKSPYRLAPSELEELSGQLKELQVKGFPAQSVRYPNTIALDSPYWLVLVTRTSQSRQHGKSESDSYYLPD